MFTKHFHENRINHCTYDIFLFSTNILDDEEPYVFAISGVIVSILALFGIVSNAMSIFIFSRPQMRSPINYILIGKYNIGIQSFHIYSQKIFSLPFAMIKTPSHSFFLPNEWNFQKNFWELAILKIFLLHSYENKSKSKAKQWWAKILIKPSVTFWPMQNMLPPNVQHFSEKFIFRFGSVWYFKLLGFFNFWIHSLTSHSMGTDD